MIILEQVCLDRRLTRPIPDTVLVLVVNTGKTNHNGKMLAEREAIEYETVYYCIIVIDMYDKC